MKLGHELELPVKKLKGEMHTVNFQVGNWSRELPKSAKYKF